MNDPQAAPTSEPDQTTKPGLLPGIDAQVMQRLNIPAPRPSAAAFHPIRPFLEIAKSVLTAITPYGSISPPNVKRADFPEQLPPEVHEIVAAALAHEDQRTARFDLKSSAFLSTSGILIPLIITLIPGHARYVEIVLLMSVLVAALSGVASFRALQLKEATKLSMRAAFAENGDVFGDAKTRLTITLIHVLKTEEAVNDHRAKLIGAGSTLLGTATLLLCAAAIAIVV